MGMDIYGENHERLTQTFQGKFDQAVAYREQFPRDSKEYEEAQKEVHRWYEEMHKPENEYFRVSYNPYSLAWWIHSNVDESAKGSWGLEPFYSASEKENPIRSAKFRDELLKTATQWYKKALELKDQRSYLADSDKAEKVVLKPEQTNSYIEYLHDLVVFAETVKKRRSTIKVSA